MSVFGQARVRDLVFGCQSWGLAHLGLNFLDLSDLTPLTSSCNRSHFPTDNSGRAGVQQIFAHSQGLVHFGIRCHEFTPDMDDNQ